MVLVLNINGEHLLITDYLPTYFEASRENVFELSVAQVQGITTYMDRHTDRPTDRHV